MIMAFFLNPEDQAKHERETPTKVKRSYNKRQRDFQITRESGVRVISGPELEALKRKHNHKPSHFDGLLSSKAGKLISSVSHFTEGGILLACIYELETGQYEVKHWDVNFNVTYQEVFNTLDECEQSFDKYRDSEQWESKWGTKLNELGPNAGLLQCIKDVWKRTGQITNEHYFLFRLLTNPDERRKYEIEGEDELGHEYKSPAQRKLLQDSSNRIATNMMKCDKLVSLRLKGLDLLKDRKDK